MEYLNTCERCFVLAIGDDYTDENLYEELPDSAITIKAGINKTLAKYHLESFKEVRGLLRKLAESNQRIKNKQKIKFLEKELTR